MLEEGEETYNERFNAGMTGSKGWVYEGGIRVPMVVRAPELIQSGLSSDDLVHFTDWLPTLLSMTGVARVGELALDGRDLSPILRGEPAGEPPPRFWQFNFYAPDIGTNAAMRDGNWKLLQPMISGTRFFRDELCKSEEDIAHQGFCRSRAQAHGGSERGSRCIARAQSQAVRPGTAAAVRPVKRPRRTERSCLRPTGADKAYA